MTAAAGLTFWFTTGTQESLTLTAVGGSIAMLEAVNYVFLR